MDEASPCARNRAHCNAVAVCCSVLQCVCMCYSTACAVSVFCAASQATNMDEATPVHWKLRTLQRCCSVLQCVAVCVTVTLGCAVLFHLLATHRNTPQQTAAHDNTLEHLIARIVLEHLTYCNGATCNHVEKQSHSSKKKRKGGGHLGWRGI